MTNKIVTKIYKNDASLTYVDSFDTAVEAGGENVINGIAQGNYFTISEADTAAIDILNTDTGQAIDKWAFVTQTNIISGVTVRIASFIIKRVTVEVSDEGRFIRLSGPNKLHDLRRASLDYAVIAYSESYTANAVSDSIVDLNPAESPNGTSDYYAGWLIEADNGSRALVKTYAGDVKRIGLTEDGWSGTTPTAGATMTLKNGPTTDDVTEVMAFAPSGWTTEFSPTPSVTGTADGTFISAAGESVFDGLRLIQEQSGEIFLDADSLALSRKLTWLRTPPTTSVTLRAPITQAQYEGGDVAILQMTRVRDEMDQATRLVAMGSNGLGIQAAQGSVTVPSWATVDWANGVLIHSDLEAAGVPQTKRYQSFPSIKAILTDDMKDNDAAVENAETAAAIALFHAGLVWLEHMGTRKLTFDVTTSMTSVIVPGRNVVVSYTGEISISGTFFVHRVRERVDSDGHRTTTLTMSSSHIAGPKTRDSVTADYMRRYDQALRHGTTSNVVIQGTGAPGGGGVTDHGALTGLADDDHPHYLRADGTRALSGNLSVNAGVTIDGVDLSAHAANAAAHHNPVTVGDGLSLSGQLVNLALASPSGLTKSGAGLALADSVAGNGLSISSKALAINLATNSGMGISSDALALGTPGTATATSTNAVSGSSHTHAVTATTDAKAVPATLLKGDANGDIELRQLTVEQLNADANLVVAPTGDVKLQPTGGDIHTANNTILSGSGWVSGFLGDEYGINTATGHADFRSIYAEELRVTAFIAEGAFIRAGSQWITPSMSEVSRDFTVPAVSSTATLYVLDIDGYPDTAVFYENDWILLRVMDRSGGGLTVGNVWGQVTNYTDLSGGEQSWTFTTRSTSFAGETVSQGAPALDFGRSGDGWIVSTTIDRAGSPYIRTGSWVVNPYTPENRTIHTQMGNLAGLAGIGTAHGFYAGLSPNHDRVVVSDKGVEMHNVTLSLHRGTNPAGTTLRLYNVALDDTADTTIYPDGTVSSSEINSSSGSSLHTDVNEDPDNGLDGNYIYNTAATEGHVWFDVQSIDVDEAEAGNLSIRANVQSNGTLGDTIIQIRAQLFKSDGTTELTEEVVLASSENSGQLSRVWFSDVTTGATQTEWNAARLKLTWVYKNPTSTEVIRLDPLVPSLAIGEGPPTNTNAGGNGIWMGYDTTTYKFRVGGTSFTGLPRMVYDGSELEFRNGATNDPVIKFASTGNSYFAGVMTIDTGGEIRQGTGTVGTDFDGLRIRNVSSIGTLDLLNNDDVVVRLDEKGISLGAANAASSGWFNFWNTSGTVVGKIGFYETAALNNSWMTFTNSGTKGDKKFYFAGATLYSDTGMFIDGDALIDGILDIDRGATDDVFLRHQSSFVAHGVTNIATTDTWFQTRPVSNTAGGAAAIGLTEDVIALALRGVGTNTETTTSTSTKAPVEVNALLKSGTGVTGYAANDAIFVVRNNFATQMIVQGDGDIYVNGTSNTYDGHDDVALARAVDLATNPDGLIRTAFDEHVAYRKDDLQRMGILGSDGRMINVTQLQRLHNGAIWQLAQRIQRLEERLAASGNGIQQEAV